MFTQERVATKAGLSEFLLGDGWSKRGAGRRPTGPGGSSAHNAGAGARRDHAAEIARCSERTSGWYRRRLSQKGIASLRGRGHAGNYASRSALRYPVSIMRRARRLARRLLCLALAPEAGDPPPIVGWSTTSSRSIATPADAMAARAGCRAEGSGPRVSRRRIERLRRHAWHQRLMARPRRVARRPQTSRSRRTSEGTPPAGRTGSGCTIGVISNWPTSRPSHSTVQMMVCGRAVY